MTKLPFIALKMRLHQKWLFIIVLNCIRVSVSSVFVDIDQNLILKICNMKFCDASKTNCDMSYCFEQMSSENKFGDCPQIVANANVTKTNCFDDCDGHDYRCSSALKCCWINSCNRSCMMAENLNRISTSTLPPIPVNVSLVSSEHEARRTAKITWLMRIPHNHCNEQVDYIVEARSHVGSTFSKHKLGQWFVVRMEHFHLEPMHSHNSKIQLRIGRFYEFRVMALNGNGTRGYSESATFQLNEKPKHLSMITNLTVDSMARLTANNSVYTRLTWNEPDSDYPIEKYELACSRYIDEGSGSIFRERMLLPFTQHFVEFYDLLPNSIYYVQVNTLASFGRKRLRSEKEAVIVNTTLAS